jgi:hypothetical protein
VERDETCLPVPYRLWGMRYVPQGGGSVLKTEVWIARGANMDNCSAGSQVLSKPALCKARVSLGAKSGQDIHRGCDFSTGFRELSTGARMRISR